MPGVIAGFVIFTVMLAVYFLTLPARQFIGEQAFAAIFFPAWLIGGAWLFTRRW